MKIEIHRIQRKWIGDKTGRATAFGEPYFKIIGFVEANESLTEKLADKIWHVCNCREWVENWHGEDVTYEDITYHPEDIHCGIVNSDILMYECGKPDNIYVAEHIGFKHFTLYQDAAKHLRSRETIWSYGDNEIVDQ